MDREFACSKKQEAIAAFPIKGVCVSAERYGNGHINDTFLVETEENGKQYAYVLQRMNHEIFKDPIALCENVLGVTSYLKEKIIEAGGDPARETLNLVPSKSGDVVYKDSIGCYWRMYDFIGDGKCLDLVEKPEDFYQSAYAFGHFQKLLADYPAAKLHETIVDFHNTKQRYANLMRAVEEDVCGRVCEVEAEIAFAKARQADTEVCGKLLAEGKLPLRVTHNDTKLNNVMIDDATGKAICVLDLDTVMPGLNMNDFGDSIRFGASTAKEDEQDLSKVEMSLELFDVYAKGFLEACGDALTDLEIEMLPFGAKIMTLECGMRFLTDYLQGDVYFNTHRPGQNLDRCRTQFKLVADMEQKMTAMQEIIKKYR